MSEDDHAAAREAAIRLLARREYATAELNARLEQRGHERATVAAVVAELADEGLVSDERFAEAFINSRVERGQGPAKIGAELRQRGVETALAEPHLEAVDWVERARAAYHHRFGNAEPPADYRERAKRMRFLQQRGFTAEQVRRVVGEDDD
ncbi:MAG: regulatory protein RecX [Pseudomonadota bacterium]